MSPNRILCGAALAGAALFAAGCRQDMHDQPKYKPLAESQFFPDHRSARPVLDGTVARGHLRIDHARYEGKLGGADIDYYPIPITRKDLDRGQERFNIYCSPCHSRLGDGQGMVVKRGFRQPPSFHIERLKAAPTGHFFDVITNGFGAMPSYASRVGPDDRWRIIAYIHALQLSQSGALAMAPPDQQQYLQQHPQPAGSVPAPAANAPSNIPATMGAPVQTQGAPTGAQAAPAGSTAPQAGQNSSAGQPKLPAAQPKQGQTRKE